MNMDETEHVQDDLALVPLEDAETGAPSAALLAVYANLPGVVVATVEYQRNAITRDVLDHLRIVRDTLAPYGEFKDWCEATGLTYSAISHRLTRRDRAEQATVVQTYAEGLPEPGPAYDHGWSHLVTYRHYAAKFPDHLPPPPPGEREEEVDWWAFHEFNGPYERAWERARAEDGDYDDDEDHDDEDEDEDEDDAQGQTFLGSESPSFYVLTAHQQAHYAGSFARSRRFRPEWWAFWRRMDLLTHERLGRRDEGIALNAYFEALADDGDLMGLGEEETPLWGTPGDVVVWQHMTWHWMEHFIVRDWEGERFSIPLQDGGVALAEHHAAWEEEMAIELTRAQQQDPAKAEWTARDLIVSLR